MDYSPLMPVEVSGPQSGFEGLPLLRRPPVRERADAARNRAAVLDAAGRLFAERGVDSVSMDEVAAAAGVGKGTLFRRFGDKAGLATALLDARETVLQERILSGPPPLGPGAEASARLVAFTGAYLDYVLAHLDLVRMSEQGARYGIGAYRFWHRHATILLTEAGHPDSAAAAHSLLATLSAEHLAGVLDELGEPRVRASAEDLARRLCT
jgi:AcrR family transcriptional regulator